MKKNMEYIRIRLTPEVPSILGFAHRNNSGDAAKDAIRAYKKRFSTIRAWAQM
jgi:hypothetical protein